MPTSQSDPAFRSVYLAALPPISFSCLHKCKQSGTCHHQSRSPHYPHAHIPYPPLPRSIIRQFKFHMWFQFSLSSPPLSPFAASTRQICTKSGRTGEPLIHYPLSCGRIRLQLHQPRAQFQSALRSPLLNFEPARSHLSVNLSISCNGEFLFFSPFCASGLFCPAPRLLRSIYRSED